MRDLVAPHVRLMADPDGSVNTFILGHFLKMLLGTALQPAFDIVDRMAKAATAAGDIDAGNATATDDCLIFSPHIDAHHRGIAIQDDRIGNLFVLELDNKIDAEAVRLERAMASIFKKPFDEEEFKKSQLAKDAKPTEVRVYRYWPDRRGSSPGSLGAAIRSGIADGWSEDLLIAAGRGFDSRADDGQGFWHDGNFNLHNLDWQDPFRLLRKAVEAHGLLAAWHEISDEVARRKYRTRSEDQGLAKYDAADEFARETAAQDRHLLGPRTEAVLQAMQDISATAEVKAMIGQVMDILRLCHDGGHTNRGSKFDHNDGDHYVYVHRLTANRVILVMGDHNREFALFLGYAGDGLAVTRAATFGRGTTTSLDQAIQELLADEQTRNTIGSFEHRDGEVTCVFGHTTDTDRVRAWTSMVSTIATACCCLEEEYRPRQARSPEMSP